MSSAILERLSAANQKLFHFLAETQRALAGQREFDVEFVRDISALVAEVDPLLRCHRELRLSDAGLIPHFDHYLRLASELNCELSKVQIMLLAQRQSLEATRTQLHAVSHFTEALSTTR